MGRLLKWLLGLVLLLVVLVIAAVIILPMVIDPNDYKDEIIAQVKQQTGRDLQIRDRLELSVFPVLAVRLGGVSLSNTPGFGEEPFARVEELDLRVGMLPLLQRRVEVDTVVLKGLGLNLARNQKGETNWADLMAESKPEQPAAEPAPTKDGPGFTLAVQGVQIEDARVVWDDRQADQRVVVEDVRLVTGELGGADPVPVEAGLRLSSDQPPLTLKVGLDGNVAVSTDFARYQADGLKLRLDASGEGLPKDGLGLDITGDLAFDQAAGTFSLKQLAAKGPDVSVSGDIAARGLNAEPDVTANLSIQETNLKNLLGAFGIAVETTDPKALTGVSGQAAFQLAGGTATVDPLRIKLDDTTLDGQAKILGFEGPVVRASLKIDDIDIDRYLPPAGGEAAQPTAGQASAPAASADPFAALRTLDLEASAAVGRLKINNLRLADVSAVVTSKKGVLRVDPAKANLYQGGFQGLVELDARQATPKVQFKQTLSGIQVGPLLQDLAGQDRLTGTGEVESNLRLVGLSEAQIRNSLNGTARFAFRDGAFKGINVAHLIREAKAALGMGPPPPQEPQQTDFSEMSGSVNITNGLVDNQDLQAKSPLLRIGGKGQVNLPKDSIDYLITTEVVKSLEGQGGRASDELAGVPIPIRLTGALADPKPTVDLKSAVNAVAKQKIEEKKQELQQDIQEKAQKEIGDALKGLFKR